MSEKPFWEGKTCEEMAGLPVKAVFKNGVTITGQLSRFGGIPISTEGMNSPISISSNTLNFRPHREISSVELLDSLEYERIDNIEDVRDGDIFVAKDLNRYSVCSVLRKEHGEDNIIQVHVVGVGQFAILRSAFSYALRPKPQLPNHGGPWLDKNGKTWIVSDDSTMLYDPKSITWLGFISPTRSTLGGYPMELMATLQLNSPHSARPRWWKHEHHQQQGGTRVQEQHAHAGGVYRRSLTPAHERGNRSRGESVLRGVEARLLPSMGF